MKSLLRNSLFCLFGACLMAACNENTVYHSYQSLPNEGWGKSDTLSFQCPVTDSIPGTLRLFAEVRNRSEYPYRNLYLFIHENLLDSTVWRTVFVKSVRPLHPGNYTVKIVHGMQDEKLTGLNDVGIRIEKQGE